MNPITMDAIRTLRDLLDKTTDTDQKDTIKRIIGKLLIFMDNDIDAVLTKTSAILK